MSKDITFREKVLPACGPGEGMTLREWADCLRVFTPATDDDAAAAIRGCVADGLLSGSGVGR